MTTPEPGHVFEPIARSRASASIVEQLHAAILDGRYGVGERLIERELAAQFGVSRITVRDALRALEAMELIEIRLGARGGAFVTAPSGDVMSQTMLNLITLWSVAPEDVVEARLVNELGTVTMACARATDAEVAGLREQCEQARVRLDAGGYERELSWRFHTLLAEAAHNGAVEGLTHAFEGSLGRIPKLHGRARDRAAARTLDEHLAIVEALERRDAAAAREAMAAHLLRDTGVEERARRLLELWP